MEKDKEKVTIRDVFELLEELRHEFTTELKDLRAEFNTKIESLRTDIKNMYTLKVEFEPVRNVVYGLVGIILTAVVGAIIYLVLQK